MTTGESWRRKVNCDIACAVTLQKRHSMRMWTKWPRWSRCIPSVNASWMLHCCLVIGLITLLIACSVFLSFLHSHHFLPAPLLNHLPHSFFISWCLLIFIFVEWEWTFIGLWCSSGFFIGWPCCHLWRCMTIAAQPAVFYPTPISRPLPVPQLQPHPLPRGPP